MNWTIKKSGQPVDFSDKAFTLYMTHAKGRQEIKFYNLHDNVVSFILEGLDLKVLGRYTLTIDIRNGNKNGPRYHIQDKCGVFELVGRSCVEEPEETNYTIDI